MKQTLFLMLGYPGAGKTTTAKVIAKLTGAEHLWADHERREHFRIPTKDSPTYTHQENIALYTWLNKVTGDYLRDGKSVIYDTGFNYYKDRQKLREIAEKFDAETLVIWVEVPKEIAKQRATKDAHAQPTRALSDMPESRFEQLTNKLEEPRGDEHVISVDGTRVTDEYISGLLGLATD